MNCPLAILLLFAASAQAAEPPVTAIAFAPDGQSLVAGSQRGVVEYSWPDLRQQRRLDVSLANTHDVAFSPDGRKLTAAGGTPGEAGVVQVLAWPSGRSLWRESCHEDLVYAVAWSEDGSRLATAAADHQCVLLDTRDGSVRRRLVGHSRAVTAVVFLPGGERVVSAGVDQSLRVWNAESGQSLRVLDNHIAEVCDLSLRPSSTASTLPMVVSASLDRTVRLWQPTIGRLVRFAQLDAAALAVTWSTDGSQILAACQDGRVRVIDPDTAEVLEDRSALSSWAYSLAADPTCDAIAIGGQGGAIRRLPMLRSGDQPQN